jgi:hypothetical protein
MVDVAVWGVGFGHGISDAGHRAAPPLLLVSKYVVDPLFESV